MTKGGAAITVLEKLQKHAGALFVCRFSTAQASFHLMTSRFLSCPWGAVWLMRRNSKLHVMLCRSKASGYRWQEEPSGHCCEVHRSWSGLTCCRWELHYVSVLPSICLPCICVLTLMSHTTHHRSALCRLSGLPHAGEEVRRGDKSAAGT